MGFEPADAGGSSQLQLLGLLIEAHFKDTKTFSLVSVAELVGAPSSNQKVAGSILALGAYDPSPGHIREATNQ